MKRFLIVMGTAAMLMQGAALAATYSINPEASEVKWHASKVTGEHEGRVEVDSGAIEYENGELMGGEAVIDMSTITVDDIKDPENNLKLKTHLKSADFFGVDENPEAMIKVTNVEKTGENTFDVTADLTIKDITHPVTFPATLTETEDGLQGTAQITVDRTKYDIRYGSGKFFENLGDRMIHDEFTLDISIEASR